MGCFDDFKSGHKRERTAEERITDRFLLLYLIQDIGVGLGDTKLQKLAYLSEMEMNLQGFKGLNFNFIRMPYGPYSSELKKDIDALVESGVISGYAHKTTHFGKRILDAFGHLIENNSILIKKIQEINRKFAHIPRDELVDIVHNMCNPERPWLTIDDTRHGSYILKRKKLWHKDRVFKLTESDVASLEIYFNHGAFNSLRLSLDEAKTKPAVSLSDVSNFV